MNHKLLLFTGGIIVLFSLFLGCGKPAGEKEYQKALTSWKDGDLSRAQAEMEQSIRKFTSNEQKSIANNQLGIILWKLNKDQEAAAAFHESCRLTEELTTANLNLAVALYKTGQYDQARSEFSKILTEQPDHPTAANFLTFIQLQNKEWNKAIRTISTEIKENPTDPALQNALAIAELNGNTDSATAITRLKKILATHPDYAPAAYNLATIYDYWLKNNRDALIWYQQYLQKEETTPRHKKSAQTAINRLDHRTKKTTTRSTKTAQQYLATGISLHAAKNYTAAISQHKKALKLDSDNKQAYYYMGLSNYDLKQYKQAETDFTKTLEIDPNFTDAHYMLALTYTMQQKWNYAEREARAIQPIDPDRALSILNFISNSKK